MSTDQAPAGGPGPRAVLDALPGSVFVIDDTGVITMATEPAGRLVGLDSSSVVGTSVLEYVDPDAVWAYAAAMDYAMSDLYATTLSGPVRISVTSIHGTVAPVDLWTANRLHDPDIAGLVCLLSPPTCALGMAEAIAAVGDGASLDDVASAVCGALGGYPVEGAAAVLSASGDGFEVLGAHALPLALVDGTAGHEPWRAALGAGERVTRVGAEQMPPGLRDLAVAGGFASVWAEPVTIVGGEPRDVVVVFRREEAEPTPNEVSFVHQGAAIIGLARLRPSR